MKHCKQCEAPVAWGKYASDALKQSQLCAECWEKPFRITSVCRADMQEMFSGAEIAKLTDGDMENIARRMADAYTGNGFWIDLEIIAEMVMEDKQRQA